ncbi:MAG TPA: ATP-binding protein, partial [Salinivirgaceae bacterium]|nr:ATP-binding protein [Salinivirgaceae bacterium]
FEKNKSLDELVVRHENEKLLKQQLYDRELILHQQEVNAKQKIIIRIIVVALLLVIILIILLIRWYRLRQKAYQEIDRKNYLLERANREIIEQHEELKKINIDIHQANEEIRAQRDYMSELIEELQQKNHQIEQTQAKLIESEKMASLGVLTAGIAHEINNPINFVFAGANCLKRDFGDVKNLLTKVKELNVDSGDLSSQTQEIIDYCKDINLEETIEAIEQTINDIHFGAVRAAEIVAGLKSFSRAETSEWIQYDLNAAIDGVLILLRNNYKNRIEIIKELDNSLPLIDCLGGKINQVIMNLLSNAIDAIDGTGKIFIKTRKVDKWVELSIRDTGIGIPEEVRKKIFDPFYTTKPVGKGTGLGLSITYGIVQEHHGTIEVISNPGEGTEFIIRLPMRKPE